VRNLPAPPSLKPISPKSKEQNPMEKIKWKTFKKPKILGITDEDAFSQIPNLRGSPHKSPVQTKKEKLWDSRVYRISMINSVVHKHYRTLFEHIAKKV